MKRILFITTVLMILCVNTVKAQWKTTGNSATNPSTDYLGTSDNVDMVFRTNEIEKMRNTSSGNIGFGTNAPVNNFQLHNESASVLNSGFTVFQLTNATTGTTASDGLIIKMGANAVSKNAVIWNNEFGSMFFGTNNLSRLIISEEGNVVVGETFLNSISKFQVDGGSTFNGPITVENTSTLKGNVFIQNSLAVGLAYAPLEKLEVNGKIKMCTTVKSPADDGVVMWDGSDFLGHKNGTWVSLTGENAISYWQMMENDKLYTTNYNVGINVLPKTSLHVKNISTSEPATMRFETSFEDVEPVVTDFVNTSSGLTINHQNKDVFTINASTATINNQLIINRPNTNTPDISITKNGADYYPVIRLENSFDDGNGWDGIVNTTFDIYNQNAALNFRANNGNSILSIYSNQVNVYQNQINYADLKVLGKLAINCAPLGGDVAATIAGDVVIRSNNNSNINVKIYSEGKIWVKSDIKVQEVNTWGDFVFDKDYDLKSLSEVEAFINANKHLPGLPSAKEVEKNGINLGEMSNTLTQKIEEMTLYMIEMNKTIEQLNKKNMELEKEVKELREEVKSEE